MLTSITIANFKRFERAEVPLGETVVFIGPNNSGKSSALQALALWNTGVQRWAEKGRGKEAPKKRPGITINRKDLFSVPVPQTRLLWHDLHLRDTDKRGGKVRTRNVLVDISVEGVTAGKEWRCGFEFDYANEEVLYCRPSRLGKAEPQGRMPVPDEALAVKVAFLPPMSGLADREFMKQPGEIGVLIGQGRTAEVLRNLCYQVASRDGGGVQWDEVRASVKELFGVYLQAPEFVADRGEIVMGYQAENGVDLDLSSSGRGLQQTLLLLSHMALNPGAVLLLDEPDAHLEILRQRQIYQVLTDRARAWGNQLIIASHSEVVLNEAADRDVVVAFVGTPFRMDNREKQAVSRSLKEVGFEQYYQAEQKGWVLYLEGSTDLAILRAFAKVLGHEVLSVLNDPFVRHVGNQPKVMNQHFTSLHPAKRDLVGFGLFDRLGAEPEGPDGLTVHSWTRREIENYLCYPEALLAWARADGVAGKDTPLLSLAVGSRQESVMKACIEEQVPPAAMKDRAHRWWAGVKASEEFLAPVFEQYYGTLGIGDLMRKSNYHELAPFVPRGFIDAEVVGVLDAILGVAKRARPRDGGPVPG